MDQKHKTQIESIRLADFPDLPAISDAWRVAYAELYPYKYPHRWRWMFEENPFSQRDGGKKLPMIIATTKNRVAAWACAMETPVFFDNDIIPAAFSCNTFTLPEFRQRGLGGRIQRKIIQDYPVLWSISMSSGNRRNKIREGGIPGKPLYVCYRRFREFDGNALMRSFESVVGSKSKIARKLLRSAAIKKMMAIPVQLLARQTIPAVIPGKEKIPDGNGSMAFKPLADFDGEWDAVWQRDIRPAYDFGVDRSAAYMNWKFVRQPHVVFHREAVIEQGRISGMLVYRLGRPPELPMGMVVESLLSPGASPGCFTEMVSKISRKLCEMGAIGVYWGISDPAQLPALERQGYHLVRINVPILQLKDEFQTRWRKTAGRPQAKWLLSLGDQDQDQLYKDQQPSFSTIASLLRRKIPGIADLNLREVLQQSPKN